MEKVYFEVLTNKKGEEPFVSAIFWDTVDCDYDKKQYEAAQARVYARAKKLFEKVYLFPCSSATRLKPDGRGTDQSILNKEPWGECSWYRL